MKHHSDGNHYQISPLYGVNKKKGAFVKVDFSRRCDTHFSALIWSVICFQYTSVLEVSISVGSSLILSLGHFWEFQLSTISKDTAQRFLNSFMYLYLCAYTSIWPIAGIIYGSPFRSYDLCLGAHTFRTHCVWIQKESQVFL